MPISTSPCITERMTEHNIAAVCPAVVDEQLHQRRTQMCRDGAPAGFGLRDQTPGAGRAMQWHYQGIGKAADYQFAPTTSTAASSRATTSIARHQERFQDGQRRILRAVRQRLRPSALGQHRADQRLQLERKWKVEVREVETGNRLPRRTGRHLRPAAYDPFQHERMNTNSTAMTFPTLLTSHMFEAVCSSPTTALKRNHRDRRIRPQLCRNDVAPARTLRYVRLPAVVTAAVRTEAERGKAPSDRRSCARRQRASASRFISSSNLIIYLTMKKLLTMFAIVCAFLASCDSEGAT